MAEGRLVTLNSSSYSTPPVCCSCGAPQQTTVSTKLVKGRAGGGSTTLTMNFPYCQPCADRVKAFKAKRVVAVVVALGAALAMGGLVFALPMLPMAVSVGIALLLGVGGAVGVTLALKPKAPPAPATTAGEAVRIHSFKPGGGRTVLHCTNTTWAEHFAHANGVQTVPKSKGDGFVAGPIVVACLTVPIAAFGCWAGSHPSVYVDNAGAEALQIWVDGSKTVEVGADAHTSFSLGWGEHTFGWSKVGASAPTSTVKGDVQVGDAHLYNPAKSACYWLEADAYGNGSTAGLQKGPQPIQEFYHFDSVDTWFGNNPQSISTKSGGGTRVALQRASTCMEAVAHGCSLAVREQLVSCQRAAFSADKATFEKCTDDAIAACQGGRPAAGTVAAAAHPASGPKPAAKTPVKAPAPAPKKK
jgi:hypothetical protein